MSNINITQFKEIIEFSADSKKENINLPLFIWGSHGIGKTTVVTKMAKDMGYDCVVLNLANQTPEELLGCPKLNEKTKTTEYYKPEWLKNNQDKPVVYFVDEMNRAPKYVLQAMFSFINEGRLHTHHINENDIIIAAGNPASMDYEVTEFDDKAFLSRFIHLYLEPDTSEILQYMNKIKVNDIIVDMIKEDPEMFDTGIDKVERVPISTDPRMIEKLGQILNIIDNRQLETFGYELIEAMVGADRAAIIYDKIKEKNSMPSIKDFFANKVDLSKRFTEDRIDIINTFNTMLCKEVIKLDKNKKLTKEKGKTIHNYLHIIPKDAALGFMNEFYNNSIDAMKIIDIFSNIDEEMLYDLMEVEA